jgi:hypothetical protein
MSRNLKYLLIALLVGVGAYFLVRPFFIRASDLEWERTVATYPAQGAPQAVVHGWTNTPLEQCRFSLLWKTGDDKWLVYDLGPGASWDRYQLRLEGTALVIAANGKNVGLFTPDKGELLHVTDKRVDKAPTAVIHGAHLDHEKQWVYYTGGQ